MPLQQGLLHVTMPSKQASANATDARQTSSSSMTSQVMDTKKKPSEGNVLHKSIEERPLSVDFVDYHLSHGISVNEQRGGDGMTVLHLALTNSQFHLVDTLLQKGANPNLCSKSGLTAVHQAAANGELQPETLDLLKECGGDVNRQVKPVREGRRWAPHSMWTALHFAAAVGNCASIRKLVELGANIGQFTMNNAQALAIAVENSQWEAATCLLECGADPNTWDEDGYAMVLHMAVSRGTDGFVKSMLDHGAKVNVPTQEGAYPIHLVCSQCRPPLAEYLLTAGANINDVTNTNKETLLHLVAKMSHLPMIQFCLRNGGNVTASDAEGKCSLGRAVESHLRHPAVIGALLEHHENPIQNAGSLVNQALDTHIGPVYPAMVWDLVRCAQDLSDIQPWCFDAPTALHRLTDLSMEVIADPVDRQLLMNALLWRGCPLEVGASDPDPPLLRAARHNHTGEVLLLLAHGANPTALVNKMHAKTTDAQKVPTENVKNLQCHKDAPFSPLVEEDSITFNKEVFRAVLHCDYNRETLHDKKNSQLPDPSYHADTTKISLMKIARLAVRRQLKEHFRLSSIASGITKLPIGTPLKSFLLLDDLCVPMNELNLFSSGTESLLEENWDGVKSKLNPHESVVQDPLDDSEISTGKDENVVAETDTNKLTQSETDESDQIEPDDNET